MIRSSAWLVACCAWVFAAGGQAAASAGHPVIHPLRTKDPAALAAAKRASRLGAPLSSSTSSLAAPASPQAVVTGRLNQVGLTATDNAARNDGTPSDSTGAAGPSHYVEFVNSVIRVYSKSDLAPVGAAAQADDFVGATNDAVFDVQIQWDPQGNRWFYLADDCTAASCATTNNLAYGWSKTPDPTDLVSGWCRYKVRTDNKGGVGLFDDYPKLGHNDSQLIFGTNVYNAANQFVSARIWTIPKPSPSTTTCAAAAPTAHYWSGPATAPVRDATVLATSPLLNQDGTTSGTPVPANTADASANGYVLAARDPDPASKIMAWHVDGSGTLVADGDIAVSAYAPPGPVPQPGTSDTIDSLDERLTQAVAHADPDAGGAEAVWTQHTINGPSGRSVARWYELLPATKTRRQEGNVSDPSNFVFNAAISPAMSGDDAVIQYNVGGPSQLAQLWASSRKPGQPLNAMSSPVKLGDSSHFDQDFSCPSQDPTSVSCRWGDYAGASPDPAAATGAPDGPEHRVWGTSQLSGSLRSGDPSLPHWLTRNFAVVPDRVAPAAAFSATPSTATRTGAVTLDGSASHDTETAGGIASFAWDFDGDGTVDQTTPGPTVTHTYASLGTFTPRLVVTDSDDSLASAPATQSVTVQNVPPTASLTVLPTPAVRGQRTTISGAASSDPDGSIADYSWDLDGNGSFETDTHTTASLTRKFSATGNRTIRLQVRDSDGATSVATATLRVVRPSLKLSLNFPKRAKLATVLAKGLRGRASCRLKCTATIRLKVPRKIARRLGTKTTVATGRIRINGAGAKKVTLKLGSAARTSLARANPRTLSVTVSGVATDASRRRSTTKRVVKLKR